MTAPLKRHNALKNVSRDHHDGLLLCWKIREGSRLGIETSRIAAYCLHFFHNALQPHFQLEEKYIFTILPANNPMREKAVDDHGVLSGLFTALENGEAVLGQIETVLSAHIRFEERVLFQEIQRIASPEELLAIEAIHKDRRLLHWEDNFWEKQTA